MKRDPATINLSSRLAECAAWIEAQAIAERQERNPDDFYIVVLTQWAEDIRSVIVPEPVDVH